MRSKSNVEEYFAAGKKLSNAKTGKEAEEFEKEFNQARKYFQSKKFKNMEVIYKKCDKKSPRPSHEPPFWLPKNQ